MASAITARTAPVSRSSATLGAPAFVTSVPGPNGPRVGAAVVSTSGATPEALRAGARELLSAFKVPSVWLVVTSADDIPRGGTGKVLATELRDLLIAAG